MNLCFLCSLLLCCTLILPCAAQPPSATSPSPQTSSQRANLNWAGVQQFSGSNRPFAALRRNIEGQLQTGVDPLTLYRKHLKAAAQGKTTSLYVLLLTANAFMTDSPTTYLRRSTLVDRTLEIADQLPSPPQNYEFVRAGFLLASRRWWFAKRIAPIGRLLLKQQPNDWQMEYRYGNVLNDLDSWGGNDTTRQAALQYALRLQNKYNRYKEKRSAIVSLLSSAYSNLANVGDSTARDKEIALYQQALAEYRRRPQTPRVKENIRNTTALLNYARKHRS